MNIFYEIHKDIPREGPGDNESTRKAFSMLTDLPKRVNILDIGCGPGMQTIELAKLIDGQIIALDAHEPFLKDLNSAAVKAGVSGKIETVIGTMFSLNYKEESFDLIWSEGAIFIIGFKEGLDYWKRYVKKGGYVVVSELSWISDNPPEEAVQFWHKDYPAMKSREENIKVIKDLGYKLIDDFVIPDSAWMDNYYLPVEKRVSMLKEIYKDDEEAQSQLEGNLLEIDMFRKYSEYYGYVFYIMQV